MKDFLDSRFQNHPAIAPVINLHVFKSHVILVAHTKLQAEIKALSTKLNFLDKLNDRMGKLEKEKSGKWLCEKRETVSEPSRLLLTPDCHNLCTNFNRFSDVIKSASYAKYGVTTGVIKNYKESDPVAICFILLGSCPSWIWVAAQEHLDVLCIVTNDNTWLPTIKRAYKNAPVVNLNITPIPWTQ